MQIFWYDKSKKSKDILGQKDAAERGTKNRTQLETEASGWRESQETGRR